MPELEHAGATLALQVRELSVMLGRTNVLRRVAFDAEAGRVVGILGPNGAGKTTLLRAVAGLISYSGHVALQGKDVSSMTRRELARALAFVPQRSLLTARLPVHTVVSHGRYAHQGGRSRASSADLRAIEQAMAWARVTELASREFPELSMGEQRRVLLARALASEASVLLLDEPTAALDIQHALALHATLRALADQGRCVLAVLHHLDDALRYTDRCLLLFAGEPLAFGATREILSHENVRRAYGVELVERDAPGFRIPRASP